MSNVIGANQAYTKKKLVYDSTISVITRMLSQMEMTEGFIPSKTPVYFIGNLQNNSNFLDNYKELDMLDTITLLSPDFAITYQETYNSFFKYILNTKVTIREFEGDIDLVQTINSIEMPEFPQKGSCQMVNGVMVVKLSE